MTNVEFRCISAGMTALGYDLHINARLNEEQTWGVIEQLLGEMSGQKAREGLQRLFPELFAEETTA